jgi:hypothetical protein
MPESIELLSLHALNRATLARQLLLQRARLTPLQAIRRLVALQAQAPNPPYLALWSRLEGFAAPQLTRLIERGTVLRSALLRTTLHLVAASEYAGLRQLLQPVMARGLQGAYGRALKGLDLAPVLAHGAGLLAAGALTHGELGRELQKRWPERDHEALAAAMRNLAPLVHQPPAGTWDSHAHARLALAAGAATPAEEPDRHVALCGLALRYLAAFGPASAADMSAWCGLSGLAPVFDTLRPRLREFRDEQGRVLFDLPRAPRPDPEAPCPPRLLGEWDNLLLSHDDRSRVLSDRHRAQVFTANGLVRGTALLDGFVAGTWTLERGRTQARLAVTPFVRWPAAARAALHEEGLGLLGFAAPGLQPEVQVLAG